MNVTDMIDAGRKRASDAAAESARRWKAAERLDQRAKAFTADTPATTIENFLREVIATDLPWANEFYAHRTLEHVLAHEVIVAAVREVEKRDQASGKTPNFVAQNA